MNNRKTLRLILAVVLALVMIVPMISIPVTMTASAAVPTAEELADTTSYVSEDFEGMTVGSKATTGDSFSAVPNVAPVRTEDGHGKYVRVPIIGTEGDANDSNWDKSIIIKNPANSYKDGYMTFEADYRPHYDSTVGGDPTVELQLSAINYTASNGTSASKQWISFGYIYLKTGEIGYTLGGTLTGAAGMTLDAWNHLQIVLDLATGTYTLLVNGAIYAYNCNISGNADDASVRFATLGANTFIAAKVSKMTGSFQTDTSAENYSYIDVDNVAFRTATESEKALFAVSCTDGQSNITVTQPYKTQNGDYLRVPFIGTAITGSGANGSGNYDKETHLNNNVLSPLAGSVVFEAKYRPHYVALSGDSSAANYCGYEYTASQQDPTVEIQAHGKWMKADGTVGGTSYLTFGYINLRTGSIDGMGGTKTGAAGLTADAWNTVKVVIDLNSGTFCTYVNGDLYLYDGTISNGTNQLGYYMSLNANSFMFAKTNKRPGAYLLPALADAGREYSYMDVDDMSLRALSQEEKSYMLNFETEAEQAYGRSLTYTSQEITYSNTSYGTWRVPTAGAMLGEPAGFERWHKSFNATTYSVTTIVGQKCLKIPFEGYCIRSSGAPYNVGGNADARIISATPAYSWALTPNLVFEADYYYSTPKNGFQVIVQFQNLTYINSSGKPAVQGEATLFRINTVNGLLDALGGGTTTGAAGMTSGAWNKIKAVVDMVNGTYNVYVNGNLYATGCKFNANSSSGITGTCFSARTNSFALFKGGKVQGNPTSVTGGTPASEYGYWENSTQYVAMDNVQIYMPSKTTVTVNGVENTATVGDVFSIEKAGYTLVSAVVTDSTGTRTIYTDTFTVVSETTVTATYTPGVTYISKNFEENALYAAESGNASDLKRSITLQEDGNKFLRVPFVGDEGAYTEDGNWDRALKVKNKAVPAGELIEITGRFRPHRSTTYSRARFQVQVNGATYKDAAGATQKRDWLGIFELELNDAGVSITSENASGFTFVEGQSGTLAYDQWYTITAQLDSGNNRVTVFVNGEAYKTGTIMSGTTDLALNANSLIVAKCNKWYGSYAPASTDLKTGDYSYVDIDDISIIIPAKVDVTVDGGAPVQVTHNSYYTIEKTGYTFVSAVVTDDAGTRTVYNDTILINGPTTVTATWRVGEYFLAEGFEGETAGSSYTSSTLNVGKVYEEGDNNYLRIPFVGGEAYATDSNWDKSLVLNHKAVSSGDRIFLTGKYRPHRSSTYSSTTVEAQVGSYTFYDVDASTIRTGSFLSLFYLNLSNGALFSTYASATKTGAPGLAVDEWNDVAVLIDTATMEIDVYVNGLLYMVVPTPRLQYWANDQWNNPANVSNFSINANSLILAKCNKITGAYAPANTNLDTGDYSYVDVDDFELTKETENIMVDVTVNEVHDGGTEISMRKILPHTSILLSSTATEFLVGGAVNSGNAVYYPQYRQLVIHDTANVSITYSKTAISENFEDKTVGTAYTGSNGVGSGPSSAVIAQLSGNKYVHVNLAPGASNNPTSGDENVDRNLTFASPAIPYAAGTEKVILSADYYLDADSNGSIQSQYHAMSGTEVITSVETEVVGVDDETGEDLLEQVVKYTYKSASKSWVSLYCIDAATGGLSLNQGGTAYANIPIGQWTTISTVLDLATGNVTIFVNGVLVYEYNVGLINISLGGNSWIVAKINKTSQTLAGGFGFDNVKEEFAGGAISYTRDGNTVADGTTGVLSISNESVPLLFASVNFNGIVSTTSAPKVLVIDGFNSITTTNFDPSTVVVTMDEGAAVRFSNPTGLRFSATLDAATVALLDDYVARGYIDVKLGFLIAPTSYVANAAAFTKAELRANQYVDVEVAYGDWLGATAGRFAGALVGIKNDHLNKSFSGVAYVIVQLMSGNEVIIYADYDAVTGARSVAEVAQAALDAGDFNNDTEKVYLESFLPITKDISGYLTSSTVISELHATNTAIYFKYNGSYIRLTYTGNYGFRIQANRTGWNSFNDIGAAQALAFAAGDDLNEGTSQKLERIWIESGDATCIRIRGGNGSKDSNTYNRPYIKLDSNGSSFGMTINNGDNNYTVAATGAKGASIGSVNSISYSNGKFTITGGLTATEGIYGGGETLENLNKRGTSLTLYTSDGYNKVDRTYCAIPFFTTTRGLGIFMNRYERVNFTSSASGSSGSWSMTIDNDLLDCYLFASGSMQSSLSAYADLTGHANMPAEWSDGVLVCRYGPDYGVLRGTSAGAKGEYTYLGDGIVDIVINYIEAGAKMNAVIFEGLGANAFLRVNNTDTSVIADRDADGNLQYNTNNTVTVNGVPVKYDLKVKTVTEKGSRVQMWRDIIEYLHSLDIRCMVYMTPGSNGVVGLGSSSDYLVHVNCFKDGEPISGKQNVTAVPKVLVNATGASVGDSAFQTQGWTYENATAVMYYLDITNDEAVEWYFNTMWKQYLDLGIDGVKIDFCEEMPDTGINYYSGGNAYTFTYNWADPSKLYTPDAGSEHHGYATLFNTMFYKFANAYAETVEGQDGFIVLTRGGGIGSQRNPYMWAGDQMRDWNAGSRQLLSLLTYGISGVPFTTYDMAGYQYTTTPTASASKPTIGADNSITYYKRTPTSTWTVAYESQEFVRSVEYTAFTNTFQTHGWVRHWYELSTQAQTIYKQYVALHNSTAMQALLDYYQQKAVDTGVPVVRPLVLNYQSDTNVYGIEDQFMLGDAILVCPILTQGTTQRSVYLPASTNGWLNMNTTNSATVAGGKTISPKMSYNKIAVYINKDLETTDPTAYALALAVYNSAEWQAIVAASNVTSFTNSAYTGWRVVSSGLHTYN